MPFINSKGKTETTVEERREADAGWLRRTRRSLGRNKHFRARVRAGHELREAIQKLAKAEEKKQSIQTILAIATQRNTIGRLARKFMNMARRGNA